MRDERNLGTGEGADILYVDARMQGLKVWGE